MKKVKTFSAARIGRVKLATNKCFEDAKNETMSKIKDIFEYDNKLVDELYRVNVCKLKTAMLKDIMAMHYAEIILRAPITLDAIRTELANREILGE